VCLNNFGGEGESGTIYTHVSKCKNDEIKGEKKEKVTFESFLILDLLTWVLLC
jgi:hypothetical protein